MDKLDAILELVAICRVQVALATRKKHKLLIYDDMLERIVKVVTS